MKQTPFITWYGPRCGIVRGLELSANQPADIAYIFGDLPPRYPLPVPEEEMIRWCEPINGMFLDFMYGELDIF